MALIASTEDNPTMEMTADGTHQLSASPSCNVPPKGGIIAGQDPRLLSRSLALPSTTLHLELFPTGSLSSAAFGASTGSLWQHLHLPPEA